MRKRKAYPGSLYDFYGVEQWLTHKNHLPAIVGVAVTAVCLAIFGREIFLIPSMVLIAVLLTLAPKTGRRKEHA